MARNRAAREAAGLEVAADDKEVGAEVEVTTEEATASTAKTKKKSQKKRTAAVLPPTMLLRKRPAPKVAQSPKKKPYAVKRAKDLKIVGKSRQQGKVTTEAARLRMEKKIAVSLNMLLLVH